MIVEIEMVCADCGNDNEDQLENISCDSSPLFVCKVGYGCLKTK